MRVGPLELKVRLVCGDGYAIGPGKADLLDAIARTGSIAAAARSLGMSYRRAWLLVDECNRCFTARLVDTPIRGAHLTAFGHAMLAAYRAVEAEAAAVRAGDAYATLAAGLRDAPLPPSSIRISRPSSIRR